MRRVVLVILTVFSCTGGYAQVDSRLLNPGLTLLQVLGEMVAEGGELILMVRQVVASSPADRQGVVAAAIYLSPGSAAEIAEVAIQSGADCLQTLSTVAALGPDNVLGSVFSVVLDQCGGTQADELLVEAVLAANVSQDRAVSLIAGALNQRMALDFYGATPATLERTMRQIIRVSVLVDDFEPATRRVPVPTRSLLSPDPNEPESSPS